MNTPLSCQKIQKPKRFRNLAISNWSYQKAPEPKGNLKMDTQKIIVTAIKVISLGMIMVTLMVNIGSISITTVPIFLAICMPYIFCYFSPNNKKSLNVYLNILRLSALLLTCYYGLNSIGFLFSDPLYPGFLVLTQSFIIGFVELPVYFVKGNSQT